MKKIKVVCGVLVQDGKVLIAQRATGDSIGKFEFPGGKVESGESNEEALIREFKEELEKLLESEGVLDREKFGVSTLIAFGYRKENPHREKTRRPMEDVVEWIK